MLLVMLAYLLLAVNVTVRSGISLCVFCGSFFVEAGVCGVSLRMDGIIDLKKHIMHLRGGREISLTARPKKKPGILELVRAGRFEAVRLQMRLGLCGAAQTAVAAGAVRAAVLSALARLRIPAEVGIETDYRGQCFLLSAQGIYSFRAGDIIHAAARAVWKRKKREGFTWKSIPLKA